MRWLNMSRSMSVRNKNSMRWMDNKEWYYIDDKRDRFVLTTKAPEEARRSFEEFQANQQRQMG